MKADDGYRTEWTRVKELQTQFLQDYLYLGLETKFGSNAWQRKLHDVLTIKSAPGSTFASQYKPTCRKMERLGVENFSTANMDISIICTLLIHDNRELFVRSPCKPALNYVKCIQDDRNAMDAHSSFDEPTFLLMSLAVTAIEHLVRLVRIIHDDTNGYAPENVSKEFCAKWELRIRELANGLESRYERLEASRVRYEEISNDVQTVRRSKDPFVTYMNIMGDKYRMRNAADIERANLQFQFEKALADAGLDFTCCSLGRFYFNGNKVIGVERDFHIAAAYYLRALDSTDDRYNYLLNDDRLHMIDLMVAGYLEGHSPEEGGRLLAEFFLRPNVWFTAITTPRVIKTRGGIEHQQPLISNSTSNWRKNSSVAEENPSNVSRSVVSPITSWQTSNDTQDLRRGLVAVLAARA